MADEKIEIYEFVKDFVFLHWGDLFSVLGFCVSLLVYNSITKVKSFYFARGRLPEIMEALKNNSLKLNKQMNSFKNNQQIIDVIIRKNLAVLKSLKDLSFKRIDGDLDKLIKDISTYKDSVRARNIDPIHKGKPKESVLTSDFAYHILAETNSIIEELKEIKGDKNWETP